MSNLPSEVVDQLKAFTSSKVTCEQMHGSGKGLVAQRKIRKGDVVMANTVLCSSLISQNEDLDEYQVHRAAEVMLARQIVLNHPVLLEYLFVPARKGTSVPRPKDMKLLCTNKQWTQAMRIVDYNSFNQDDEWLILHTLVSLINHDCDPSCLVQSDALVALPDIAKGEELTISYGGDGFLDLPFTKRRKVLSKWEFTCCCANCQGEEAAKQNSSKRRKMK